MERMLKILMIVLSPDLQEAMVPSLFFARLNQESKPRPPLLTIFSWIPATTPWLRAW